MDSVVASAAVLAAEEPYEQQRVGEMITEGEHPFRTLCDVAPIAIFVVDALGESIYSNTRCVEMSGMTAADSRREGWHHLLHPDERDANLAGWAATLRDGRDYGRIQRLLHPDGEYHWVQVRTMPLRGRGGRITGHVGTMEDITDLRRAQLAVLEWKERYEAVLRGTGRIVYDWLPTANTVTYSGDFERILGYPLAELDGGLARWLELIHPDDRPAFAAEAARADATGEPFRLEYRVRHRRGDYLLLRDDGHAIRAPGQRARMIGFLTDITERQRREAEREHLLRQEQAARAEAEAAQRRFAFLAEVSRLLAASFDYRATLAEVVRLAVPYLADWCAVEFIERDGTVSRHGPQRVGAHQAGWRDGVPCGYGREENAGHPVTAALASGVTRLLTNVPESLLLAPGGNYVPAPAGHDRTMICLVVPLFAREGQVGVLLCATEAPGRDYGLADLTLIEDLARRIAVTVESAQLFARTREREQALQVLASQLSAAEDRERRRLALDIHDSLGQKLSVLKLNLQAAVRGGPPGKTAASLAASVRLADELIEQTRHLTFDLYPAMLDHLGLVPTLQWYAEQFAGQTGIQIGVSESGSPRPLPTIIAGYLFRAIKELLANVVKHAGAQEVVLAVCWQQDRLRVIVADDGRGFPSAEDRGAACQQGLGLLSIRERLASLGGRLTVESDPGHGAEVIVEIPFEFPEYSPQVSPPVTPG